MAPYLVDKTCVIVKSEAVFKGSHLLRLNAIINFTCQGVATVRVSTSYHVIQFSIQKGFP